jgi:glycosidase
VPPIGSARLAAEPAGRQAVTRWLCLLALGSVVLLPAANGATDDGTLVRAAQAQAEAVPDAVVLVSDLQSELTDDACADWDAGCGGTALEARGGGVFATSFEIPAGEWRYRVAVRRPANGLSATAAAPSIESYGEGARTDGPNLVLRGASARRVTVVYDDRTHWPSDSQAGQLAVVTGELQQRFGCEKAPDPACLATLMSDPDGDGILLLATDELPAGDLETAIVTLDPTGTAVDGEPIPLTVSVPAEGRPVRITFDPRSRRAALRADASPFAPDGSIEPFGLLHDSRDPVYRSPPGAVPAGTEVRLRFRTFHDDVTAVELRLRDAVADRITTQAMERVAAGVPCLDPVLERQGRCDFWERTVRAERPTSLFYRFIVRDGEATAFYADDEALDGGRGKFARTQADLPFLVTVFAPGFEPLDWLVDGVVYQVFPDRFANGDATNDPGRDEPRYGWPPAEDDRIAHPAWETRPEAPRGRDYYGGDLPGLTAHLDDLADLGVTVIYLNPIFEAASNHGYDTRDYARIDHRFGTEGDFRDLVAAAKARGIRVILDGVFNHVSSDSPYFDLYGHFPEIGACESPDSPYRGWFTFHPRPSGPCAGPNGPGTMGYDAWSGVASLPVLDKTRPEVRDLVYAAPDSLARRWLRAGAAGWRLDVMSDPSFPADFWPAFRKVVKATDPQAAIVGELWTRDQVLPWIRGDAADTVMDYRFRNAVLAYLGTIDDEGFPDAGEHDQPPSALVRKLESRREDYPDAAYLAAFDLLDSHDTERALWSLAPTGTDREAPDALRVATARLRLAVVLQATLPGAPTIYYGDEAGLTGADDPDDRRTYPWHGARPDGTQTGSSPGGDADLRDWYRRLLAIRRENEVLRRGDLRFLLADDGPRTLAYGRRSRNEVAIVALNPDPERAQTLRIPLGDWLRDGVRFHDQLVGGSAAGGSEPTVSGGGALELSLEPLGAALLVADAGQDLGGPRGPPLRATLEEGAATLRWEPAAGAAAYEIWRSPLPGGGGIPIARIAGLEFVDAEAPAESVSWYRVRALDEAGNPGPPGPEASLSVPGGAAPPPGPGARRPRGSDGGPPLELVLLGIGILVVVIPLTILALQSRRAG